LQKPIDLNQVSSLISEKLGEAGFSDSEILSEESKSIHALSRDRLWIIDPLDGTREFLAGRPEFALSVCYQKNGALCAGMIFNPISGMLVMGTAEEGILIEIGQVPVGLSGSSVLCSRSEWNKKLKDRKVELPLVPVGSVANKLGLVAAGLAKATVSYEPKSSWDIAAGAFLIELNGGRITDLSGEDLDFSDPRARFSSGLLASGERKEHSELLSKLS